MDSNESDLRHRHFEKDDIKAPKNPQLNDKQVQNTENKNDNDPKKQKPYRYGPLPRFSGQRLYTKLIIIVGVVIYVWYTSKHKNFESFLAKQDRTYLGRGQNVECNPHYLDEISKYTGCIPKKCGRFVSDNVVSNNEADLLLQLAKRGMALGGSDGGATIMDLHSGALSLGDKFINFYTITKYKGSVVQESDIMLYKIVKQKIKHFIAESFGLDIESIYLTHPTFFSKLTNADPVTAHDEYWHVHVDQHTYESFHYTSLLYLTDLNKDFEGGKFVFLDDVENPKYNVTVEPRKGRVLTFTSGAENPHFVEKVTHGERYAITVSFTCDRTKSIKDPLMK